MFSERSLAPALQELRQETVPEALVLDVDQDFETLPPAVAEELGLLVDALDPATYPAAWLPESAPAQLQAYASGQFTIGLPGDGTVVRTDQTEPPTVLVKARAAGTPDPFLRFLLAEALVELDLGLPESFLPFFGEQYAELDAALGLDGTAVYQVATALYDAWVGLHTRGRFEGWAGDHDELHDAWIEAGERLTGRIEGLPGEVARGEMGFPAATELACSAVKHGLDLPAPFAALDTLSVERGYSRRSAPHIHYASGPEDIAGILDNVGEFLGEDDGPRRLTVDSITELAYYADEERALDAVEKLVGLVREHDAVALFHLSNEVHDDGVVREFTELFDGTIRLDKQGNESYEGEP